jgi:hypothetical protein
MGYAHKPPHCPARHDEAGVPRRVSTVPGRTHVIVGIVCASCGHEWTIEKESRQNVFDPASASAN